MDTALARFPALPVLIAASDPAQRAQAAAAARSEGCEAVECADGMQLLGHVLTLLRRRGVFFMILAERRTPAVAEVLEMLGGTSVRDVAVTTVFSAPVCADDLRAMIRRGLATGPRAPRGTGAVRGSLRLVSRSG